MGRIFSCSYILLSAGEYGGSGELLAIKKSKKLSTSLQPASLGKPKDGYLHFGQRAMIINEKTGCFLCTDAGDTTEKVAGLSFACATGPCPQSCVRNVFQLCRPRQDDNFGSQTIVHFGQPVSIKMDPQLSETCPVNGEGSDRFLHSELISPTASAKISNFQQVLFCPAPSANAEWKIFHVDPRIRFETEGSPVPANAPVVIKHARTGQMLASSPRMKYINDFGVEYEVYCKSYLRTNKTQNLIAESLGRTTSDIDSKQQEAENNWMILTVTEDGGSRDPFSD
ncbi:EF hand family protein [Besnoitia besnoiti]|uniref:EF hand family protein n=1 Tax=Besnoitia besnoiti TaxID=94643 RepID=A0A2A9MMF1_BESBE|nr:EF hand family protein [Besnoitia besnoiti]PFH36712.1 EF hand family protein [Besnoitia besnoiti]